MTALLCRRQIKLGAGEHDFALIADVVADDIHQSHQHGLAARDGDHIDAERRLEIGVFVEQFQDLVDVSVGAHFDDRADTLAVGLVLHARDRGKLLLLLLAQVCDLPKERRLVDLIGKLGDDDGLFAVVVLFDVDAGAQRDAPLARAVRLFQLVGDDIAACREVGRGDIPAHLLQGDLGIVDIRDDAVNGLSEVVRRDVGRKPDGNARGPVDEQVGKAPGEHVRLL